MKPGIDEQIAAVRKAANRFTVGDESPEALSAAIETLQSLLPRPIATAPKDGTRILCWVPYHRSAKLSGGWHDAAWSHYHQDFAADINGFTSSPTHWLPLPEAPRLALAAL